MSSVNTVEKLDRVLQIFKTSESKIRPHCIVTGPSGSGKTFNVDALCTKHDLPSIEINAAQLTKEGMTGNSLSKALTPLLQYAARPVVVKVDEFDKLFISGNTNSELAHEVTTGVQNEFLRVLESNTTSVFHEYGKYAEAKVNNALFIFMGAFNGQEDISIDDLRALGLKTEFLGRVGLVYNVKKPTMQELLALLEKSELLELYSKLMPQLPRKSAVKEISAALKKHYENNTLGVRAINTLIHQFYINGGLKPEVAKTSLFTKTLDFSRGGSFK